MFERLLTNELCHCYSGTMIATSSIQIEHWPLSRFIPYARNPRKNDHAVDRMAASIREFGFRVPVLARSSGDVVERTVGGSRLRRNSRADELNVKGLENG